MQRPVQILLVWAILVAAPHGLIEARTESRPETPAAFSNAASENAGEAPAGTSRNLPPGQSRTQDGEEPTEAPSTLPEDAYEYTEPDFGENRVSYTFLVLRTLAILAVIVLAIFIVFKIFLKNRQRVVSGTDVIRVLATYPLAGNKSLQIVEIAEKVFILGVTDSNINLISPLDDKEAIDRIRLASSKETKGFQSFKEHLLKLISGKAFSGQGQISNFNDFKQRINRMKKF